MSFWNAVVLIVLAGSAVEIIRIYAKRPAQGSTRAEKQVEELSETVIKHEKRIENLETILLDKEHDRRFDGLS